ncbi:MAG: flagellar export protein FliJ [Thermodesulfobacteriota bacterium]|nr:flagellar export protein FliJ [Thermodesulfobacteriota bacterium]
MMKPFTFRLDKILDYRKYLSKIAQIDLFNAKTECIRREKKVKRLSEKRKEIAKSCIDEGVQGIDVPRYKIYLAYLYKIEHDLESAHTLLEQEKENVITKKAILTNESIKKKTLETLKDLKHNKYIELSERKDQKVLDEIVITGRGRRS